MSEEKAFVSLDAIQGLLNDSRLEYYSINGTWSLLDFDSVIVCPEHFFDAYKPEGKIEDLPKLGYEDSRRIVEDYSKVKKQLIDLLQQGKNIYVLTGFTNKCYRYTGGLRPFSLPTEVKPFELYSFLPIRVSLEPMRGYNIELTDLKYKDFFNSIGKSMEYNSVIHVEKGLPFLKIKGTDKVVGTIVPCINGKIVFLPYFNGMFTSNGIKGDELRQRVFNAIYSLDELLTKKEIVEYPEWIDDYNILTEDADIEELNNLKNEEAELQKRIEKQEECLGILKKYKGLFTSTGKQLETVTKEIFEKMDFQIFPAEANRTDVIAKYNDVDVVMEIKGLTKSATETHATQLVKWAMTFKERENRTPKSILVVNAFREIPLAQRTEATFPDQMLEFSISQKQCLISTIQLLCLFIEITDNPDCKDERIKELLNTVGVYNRYKDYTQFIKKVK